MDKANNFEIATLGGGCFWCTEAVYQQIEGVIDVTSGYSGDTEDKATYDLVKTGITRHAEVIQVKYDPTVISYEAILKIFWTAHDPTTPNRQGNDVGPQYRSVIFYHDEQQKAIAEQSIANVATEIWDDPIVTELSPLEAFYKAENYHLNYYNNVGARNPYCTFVISPKVSKVRKTFAHLLKKH